MAGVPTGHTRGNKETHKKREKESDDKEEKNSPRHGGVEGWEGGGEGITITGPYLTDRTSF